MKRTFERIIFMVVGALIAFCAYLIGNIESDVNAQDNNRIPTFDYLHVRKGIIVGNQIETHSIIGPDSFGIRDSKSSITMKTNNGKAEFNLQSDIGRNETRSISIFTTDTIIDRNNLDDVRPTISMRYYKGKDAISMIDFFCLKRTTFMTFEDEQGVQMLSSKGISRD